ncbi:hypothetical protein [Bradyrhizobium sp. 2TAF24]|uniref:hypothetical protein n=1 Tax=Bradyrhizobium sp. 2TAF24 TaxID=3233011 RepID=UPI003F91C7F0
MPDNITVRVAKGVKVNIEEVEALKDADPRIPDDRNVIIETPNSLKVAVKGSDSADLKAKASVILRCG